MIVQKAHLKIFVAGFSTLSDIAILDRL